MPKCLNRSTATRIRRPEGVSSPVEKSPGLQLRESLNLDNNPEIFEEIRNNIRSVGRKHMDVDVEACCQPTAVEAIEHELVSKYPDLFAAEDSEKRLYLAVRMIYHQHSYARTLHKKKVGGNAREENSLPGTIRDGDLEKENIPQNRRASKELVSPAGLSTRIGPSISHVLSQCSSFRLSQSLLPSLFNSPSQSTQRSSNMISGHKLIPAGTGYSVSASQPSVRQSQSSSICRGKEARTVAGHSRSPSTNNQADATQPVCLFLDSCIPSMAHLFEELVDFGCANEEYLLAVSSWGQDRVNQFLHRFSASCGTPLREMDILILQNHFLTYFDP